MSDLNRALAKVGFERAAPLTCWLLANGAVLDLTGPEQSSRLETSVLPEGKEEAIGSGGLPLPAFKTQGIPLTILKAEADPNDPEKSGALFGRQVESLLLGRARNQEPVPGLIQLAHPVTSFEEGLAWLRESRYYGPWVGVGRPGLKPSWWDQKEGTLAWVEADLGESAFVFQATPDVARLVVFPPSSMESMITLSADGKHLECGILPNLRRNFHAHFGGVKVGN